MKNQNLFTSEFVTQGHPDKMCDQISDEVLDRILALDPEARVACEVMGTGNNIIVGGEITADLKDFAKNRDFYNFETGLEYFDATIFHTIVGLASQGTVSMTDVSDDLWNEFSITLICLQAIENVFNKVGYSLEDIKPQILVSGQSPDIAQGTNDEIGGAGDQCLVFGYAVNDTPDLMPDAYDLARKLGLKLEDVRHCGEIMGLLPDGKTQVTLDRLTGELFNVVVSAQHSSMWSDNMDGLRKEITEKVIQPVLGHRLVDTTKLHINATGKFLIGGFTGDTGLTGRKIVVDTYGGYAPHGGGNFNGKDATKVDRSAAYIARYIAKNVLVEYGLDEVLVQLGYVIGEPQPLSLFISSPELSDEKAEEIVIKLRKLLDLTPKGITEKLDLKNPVYYKVSSGGHFGKEGLTWENIDLF